MTEQEAMIRLDFIRCALLGGTKPEIIPNEDNVKLIDVAIKALEEVEQYRAIGTQEECRQAVEKQKAKKPSEQRCEESTIFKCKDCGYIMKIKYSDGLSFGHNPNYCEQCGQKLDWSNKK